MPERWGEYHTEMKNVDEQLLAQSDFMLSSYPQTTGSSEPTVIWREEIQLPHSNSDFDTERKQGIVEHNIQLEEYRRDLHILLADAVNLISERKPLEDIQGLADPPPVPPCVNCFKRQSDDARERFSRGVAKAPDQINSSQCTSLLKKSIAQICLHEGFRVSTQSALDALTSAAGLIYQRTLSQLRVNSDQHALNGHSSGFQDVIHRTLSDIGHGDPTSLLSDYHGTTVERHNKLLEKCSDLAEAYKQMKTNGEIPTHYNHALNLKPSSENSEATTMAVLSLSDNEDQSESHRSTADRDDVDEDDAQKLLELAGINGFDITIAADQEDVSATTTVSEELADVVLPPVQPPAKRPASKAKSSSKVGGTKSGSTKRYMLLPSSLTTQAEKTLMFHPKVEEFMSCLLLRSHHYASTNLTPVDLD